MMRKRGRDLVVPSFVALAVIGFVAYMGFQGRAHQVEYAVTAGEVSFVDSTDERVPDGMRAGTNADRMLLVEASWAAADSIAGGSYYVLVAAPPGWRNHACRPECEWAMTPDLRRYARALPVDTYRLAAKFDAEEEGSVTVTFVPPRDVAGKPPTSPPAAWLVQTDGTNVLQARMIVR